MKLDGIAFENFRVFNNKSLFELSPITILTGTNSSGKTTILKALKLLRVFWSQNGFGQHLLFEHGDHQLGDFEMTKSKQSKKDDIAISFYINHILMGKMEVEMVFVINESNTLKNGYLQRARIKQGNNILYSIFISNDSSGIGYDFSYILNKLLPSVKSKLNSLKQEYEKYGKIISENATKNSIRSDFGILISDIIDQHLIRNSGVDVTRYYQLDSLFRHDFAHLYVDNYSSIESERHLEVFIKNYSKAMFNESRILQQLSGLTPYSLDCFN